MEGKQNNNRCKEWMDGVVFLLKCLANCEPDLSLYAWFVNTAYASEDSISPMSIGSLSMGELSGILF